MSVRLLFDCGARLRKPFGALAPRLRHRHSPNWSNCPNTTRSRHYPIAFTWSKAIPERIPRLIGIDPDPRIPLGQSAVGGAERSETQRVTGMLALPLPHS